MTASSIVRMANQIARAFATQGEAEAIAHTAQHIAQFWDPRMRRQLDRLLAEGAATVEKDKRKPIYQKMQEITRHDLPYLPIFQYKMVEGTKEGLQNFTPNVSVQENCWNANQWYCAS